LAASVRTTRRFAALSGLAASRRFNCMNPFSGLTPSEVSSLSRYGSASSARLFATEQRREHLQRLRRAGIELLPGARASSARSFRRAWFAISTARRATRGSLVRRARSRKVCAASGRSPR
jgi:hypothetical protein